MTNLIVLVAYVSSELQTTCSAVKINLDSLLFVKNSIYLFTTDFFEYIHVP